jgi:thermitase
VQHNISLQIRFQAIAVTGDGSTTADLERQAEANPCVLHVGENARVESADFSSDPLAGQQAFLPVIEQQGGEDYFFHPLYGDQMPVIAATIDSGVQLNHPDLVSRLWHDPSGSVGYDFVNGDTTPADDFGHGTHVAGLIGAQRGNALGVRGVMGDLVQLMAMKTQGSDGGGTVANVINGIEWAADHGAEVMNISLTMESGNSALQDAIQYAIAKNVVIAAAAGNDGKELTATNVVAPASYAAGTPGFLSVGALDTLSLALSGFSNFSSQYVKIAAPGSTGDVGLLSTYLGSSYVKIMGTSMASPQVAGAAALVISFLKTHQQSYTNAQIETWIETAAATSPSLTTQVSGGRTLDLQRLGRLLYSAEVIDTTGGFDEVP